MTGGDEERRILLKGIVVPVDWDQTGKVRTIGVLTDYEGEYEVAPGGTSDQLMMHLRSEILAEAVLLNPVGPVKRVRIDSFAILEWKNSDGGVTSRGPSAG